MDGQRFDDLARKVGSGLSRRQLVRLLLGGAGALAGTAVLKDQVSAVGLGGACPNGNADCEFGLTCSANGTCQCNPSTVVTECPAGTWHEGNTKFLDGQCCNGNGNCCSNDCGPDNFCIPLVGDTCSEQGVECDDNSPCCENLTCIQSQGQGLCAAPCDEVTCTDCQACWRFSTEAFVCEGGCETGEICCPGEPASCVTGECCTFEDCPNESECFRVACDANNACEYSPADDLCEGDCEVCSDAGACVSDCAEGEICCPGEVDVCAGCCDTEDCTATNECFVGTCYAGSCTYDPDPGLCAGTCETCSENGACVSECGEGQICCDDQCIAGACCVDEDCTETNECRVADCYEGACLYEPDDGLCGPCELCNAEGICESECFEGVCCEGECLECCDETDCVATGECLDAVCYLGACLYEPNDDLCDCGTCNVDGVCVDGCGEGQVCCDEVCYDGDCCIAEDCPPQECQIPGCPAELHQCVYQSLCTQPDVCCPVLDGADFCYDPNEGECCTVEDCLQVMVSNETCLEVACVEALCVWTPDNANCDEGTCCCEQEGICSADCCPPVCKDDKDCDKDECCCKDGTCSHDCCPPVCKDDHDCGKDECCCKDGSCSSKCCGVPPCKSDADCPQGACCCKDGTCSIGCCDKPDDDTPEIDTLPNTGTGPGEDAAGWIAGAALAAGAAALLSVKTRQEPDPDGESEF
jgi:hypothetical protein